MSDPQLALVVNGTRYEGWQTIQVRRSLEELAGSFELTYVDEWLAESEPLPIDEFDACQITVDGKVVLTGYVDDSNGDYDKQNHSLSVSGRSKAGDLVDCAALFGSGTWRQAKLSQIAKDLCGPFNIGSRAGDETLTRFSLQEGETVFEALERAARTCSLLLTSNAQGGIEFVKAGAKSTATKLELAVNILAGSKRTSAKDRFSKYIVKAQAPGDDNFFGESARKITASAEDDQVPRYRPLVIVPEHHARAGLKARAEWERNVRAGRSQRYTYRVQGWTNAEGIWEPNTLVKVTDAYYGFEDDELLVTAVTYTRDAESGTVAELEVTFKEAFDTVKLPTPKHRASRNRHGGGEGKRSW